ncbi:Calcium-binding EF-hand [Cynara cardunculus var. scolymus]|uniref:Calcium-binding EF-hand n=2 Tax=Cynara cardunculus var. scolymus TaxID=59895 RepID=A0A124SCH7_CYNCS|nr:Calcium-binding EF-hand [Cynara cardunculus var. scolymus]
MKALGSDTSLDEMNRIMAGIDTDCDGFISLEEFASLEDDDEMKELQDTFELYDLNKNGLISAKELHQILSQLGERCTVDDHTNMIKTVDSDGDAYVNNSPYGTRNLSLIS